MAEKNASAAQTAQKFPIERLAKACRTLFHVSASTFAGATAGMTGEYTVEEMQKHIDEWLGKEGVGSGQVGDTESWREGAGRALTSTSRATATTPSATLNAASCCCP